jgi:predicted dehydrogenase
MSNRIAIVGLGNMGSRHAEIVHAYPAAELAAVVDIAPERLHDAGGRYGCATYTDLGELLGRTDVDAVMICTPDALHVEPTLRCLEAGKHVFLEKPIATSLEDADTILAAAPATDLVFTVGHCLRFDPKYVAVKRRIDAGDLGALVAITTRRQNRTSNQARLGGRVSSQIFLGVHDYDIINWYLGERPDEVSAVSTRVVMPALGYEIDDATWTTLRYPSGAVAVAETGWLLPDTYPLGYRFQLDAFGRDGVGHLEVFDDGVAFATDAWRVEPTGDRLTPQLAHFLNCINSGEAPLVSGADGRVAVEIALASEASARDRTPVQLASRLTST